MDLLPWFCTLMLVTASCQAFPFLWPSSFVKSGSGGATTTTTTTTTHTSGPPHPHAQNTHSITAGSISPAVIGHPQSSHLHIRPATMGSYLASRPLPPLVGAHHHHHLHRPISGTHSHVHGGAIAGSHTSGGHRHHFHMHQQLQPHHHHHHTARVLHHHPAALHFPIHV